jgi:FMN-dependent NADH-azoreductase
MKLLHIIASPRQASSNTLQVSHAFIDELRSQRPDLEVEVLDLYNQNLPALAGDNIEAKYTLMVGQPIDRNHAESWAEIEALVARFMAADAYLISAPLWNLSIPYALKYYIDCIVQPGYLFTYDETGQAVPLVLGKKMVVSSSRGGDYSATSPMHAYDFQEPYLRAIFGFVGITDLEFVVAEPMDVTPELHSAAMAGAVARARALATEPGWAAHAAPVPV